MNNLILFDILTTGHHINYVEFIIRYLNNSNTPYIKWKFITDTSSPNISRLLSSYPDSIVDWHSLANGSIIHRIGLLKRVSRIFKIKNCIDHAVATKANIIHFLSIDHMEVPLFIALLMHRWALKNISCKIICTVHKEAGRGSRIRRKIARRVLRYMSKNGWIDMVFVHVSEAAKDIISKGTAICQVPYPIDTDIMKSALLFSREELFDRLGLPFTQKPVCLLFGSIRPVKGINYLLKALKYIDMPCSILIVGKPSTSLRIDLIEWARTFQSEMVDLKIITEYVHDEEVPFYYALADLILLPYMHDSPGAGGPLLLASATGTPVIASDVGELGRKVRLYNLGLLCQPESALALADSLNKALSRLRMLKADVMDGAERCADEHSWQNMAGQVCRIYEDLARS
ncbi:MAG: glycosyltransferase family 4 protein [bacterium]